MSTSETPLARARRRDADRRRQRVHQALADMRTDGSDITVSAVAARAGPECTGRSSTGTPTCTQPS